ncbi:MAG: ATP-binding protein, partial [Cyanobacteria bacterium]|nr:ATP-binding protein [Cyanobacteriota bacterium]
LAIGKRCIRYEPNVFYNRKDLIIEMAKGLNDPVQKMLLITGSQGAGKTSLARGIVEMMGGGQEQLLWFDINVHTDFEEITQFLIQYINYISSAVQQTEASKGDSPLKATESEKPMPIAQPSEKMVLAQLAQNIRQVSHIPLLLVIDNIEYIVDPEYQIQSFSFKEILNFLLSFSNIKMILMGERLPYADISVDSEIVREIKLTGLLEKEGLPLLQYKLENPKPDPLVLQSIFRKSGGSPWLLRVVNYLCLKGIPLLELDQSPSQGTLASDKSVAGSSFIEMLVKNIYHRLSLEEQAIVECLSLIRHPVEIKVLIPMIRLYKPEISPQAFEVILQNLEGSLLKPLLQKNYPPQAVLRQVRSQLQSKLQTRPPDPWFELHHRYLKKVIYQLIPEEERLRAHQFLQEFYLKEKNKPFEQRIYHIKSKGLIAEATFHSNLARKRRKTVIEDASLESRSYLARGQTPAQNDKLLTLDDFRNIKLPETNIPLDPPHFRQNASTGSQRLPLTSDGTSYEWEDRRRLPSAASFPKEDDIALSESEKQLLFKLESPKSGYSINRPQKMGEIPLLEIPFEEDAREKEA